MSNQAWHIFQGHQAQPATAEEATKRLEKLLAEPAPNWRKFSGNRVQDSPYDDGEEAYWQKLQAKAEEKTRDKQRGESFRLRLASPIGEPDEDQADKAKTGSHHNEVLNAVNAALYLRRPLLVSGSPGSGKTSLAYAVAYELQLGPVLLWPITAKSNLKDGLYEYDAIARLQDAQLEGKPPEGATGSGANTSAQRDIGKYIRLGPVGTAFLASKRPRVLLIDEIDKSDINLPNELLNLFEEGQFSIRELERLTDPEPRGQRVKSDDNLDVRVRSGKVQCQGFPLIIMTSNGEREFPPAFNRRCLRVRMPSPTKADLEQIVRAHLQEDNINQFESLIADFAETMKTQAGGLATDQLLNTVYLMTKDADLEQIKQVLLKPLNESGM